MAEDYVDEFANKASDFCMDLTFLGEKWTKYLESRKSCLLNKLSF